MEKSILLTILFIGSALGQWDPNFADDRYGIVHLFEWHWGTIADECETLLGPNKIGGVQISPPTENRVVDSRPWWERYQPISYGFTTRSGNYNDLADMIDRCNAVGVRIYPDIVINHMCGVGGSGSGTGGTSFNADTLEFPGVPFGPTDFNSACDISNYNDANQVRNCRLVGLLDLNQGKDYVRGKMIDMMNALIDLGVAGFRVDACKHMWPGDLQAIFGSLSDLRSDVFGSGKRAYIYQEVIDQGGEAIAATDYTGIASVTEFKYGINLGNNKDAIQYLSNFGEAWGMLYGPDALVFINNHDNQRGHGGGGNIITFEDPYDLKIFTAYMLAWPYGVPRIMSSYYFSNSDEGPPAYQRSVESDGSCGNGWVCEHRWRQIKNMFAFSVGVIGTGVENWWTNNNNQIAFSRGSKGFFAINKAGYDMNENLYTGLQDGSYCNVVSGDFYDGKCAGSCITVSGGYANIAISTSDDPFIAIYTAAMTSDCGAGGGVTGGGGSTGGSTGGNSGGDDTCVDCNCPSHKKTDCGFMGIDMDGCHAKGCIWCENASNAADPWCFVPESTGDGNSGTAQCYVDDWSKMDCGYTGIDQTECESSGCCWAESNTSGIPWCYHTV